MKSETTPEENAAGLAGLRECLPKLSPLQFAILEDAIEGLNYVGSEFVDSASFTAEENLKRWENERRAIERAVYDERTRRECVLNPYYGL